MTDPIFDPFRAHIEHNLRKYLVGRAMFCPRTGDALDVRRSVFLVRDGSAEYAVSQAGWAEMLTDGTAEALAARGLTADPATVKGAPKVKPETPAVHPDQTTLFDA